MFFLTLGLADFPYVFRSDLWIRIRITLSGSRTHRHTDTHEVCRHDGTTKRGKHEWWQSFWWKWIICVSLCSTFSHFFSHTHTHNQPIPFNSNCEQREWRWQANAVPASEFHQSNETSDGMQWRREWKATHQSLIYMIAIKLKDPEMPRTSSNQQQRHRRLQSKQKPERKGMTTATTTSMIPVKMKQSEMKICRN